MSQARPQPRLRKTLASAIAAFGMDPIKKEMQLSKKKMLTGFSNS